MSFWDERTFFSVQNAYSTIFKEITNMCFISSTWINLMRVSSNSVHSKPIKNAQILKLVRSDEKLKDVFRWYGCYCWLVLKHIWTVQIYVKVWVDFHVTSLWLQNLWSLEGQYTCIEPRILNSTQEYENCQKSRTVRITCQPLANLTCRLSSGEVKVFNGSETAKDLVKTLPCRWTNGKSYTISCLLSLFLGVFGIDRFYLGYPVLGIIKLSTVGMLGIGALSDFLLILLQVHFTANQLNNARLESGAIRRFRPNSTLLRVPSELSLEWRTHKSLQHRCHNV